MDIQFHHVNNHQLGPSFRESQTFAVELPNKEGFLAAIENPKREIDLRIGSSLCSPRDNFSKKIGRELSSSRLENTRYKLKSMEFQNDSSVIFILQSEFDTLTLRVNEKSDRIYLLRVR